MGVEPESAAGMDGERGSGPEPATAGREAGSTTRQVLERLFARLLPAIEQWAHGRLPRHARRRHDTWDLIQDACVGAIRQLPDLDQRDPTKVDFYLRQSNGSYQKYMGNPGEVAACPVSSEILLEGLVGEDETRSAPFPARFKQID